MSELEKMVKEIKSSVQQLSNSAVDEVRVMTCMLNDPEFSYDVYKKGVGRVGSVCPHDQMNALSTDIIMNATKLSKKDSRELASRLEYSKKDATLMLNIFKEFTDVYTQSGRKFNVVQNENTEANLFTKNIPEGTKSIPDKDNPGQMKTISTRAYTKLVSHSSCPKYNDK